MEPRTKFSVGVGGIQFDDEEGKQDEVKFEQAVQAAVAAVQEKAADPSEYLTEYLQRMPKYAELVKDYTTDAHQFLVEVSGATSVPVEELVTDLFEPFKRTIQAFKRKDLTQTFLSRNKPKSLFPKFKLGPPVHTTYDDKATQKKAEILQRSTRELYAILFDKYKEAAMKKFAGQVQSIPFESIYLSFQFSLGHYMMQGYNPEEIANFFSVADPDLIILNPDPWQRSLEEYANSPEGILESGSFTTPTKKPPKPSSSPKPPAYSDSDAKLVSVIETLLSELEATRQVDITKAVLDYETLPTHFKTHFFSPNLTYAITDSMRRLQEAYNVQRNYDSLFSEFIHDRKWRAAFVFLVASVYNLQRKTVAFQSAKSARFELAGNVEAAVSKFLRFPNFHRVPYQPPIKYDI